MSEPGADLPEAAPRRLTGGAWSSGLTVADFAACEAMGLRPLALVQGFCAMQWGYSAVSGPRWSGSLGGGQAPGPGAGTPYSSAGAGDGYHESWPCPHSMVSLEHRWGYNFEQPWVETAWSHGFAAAYGRMVEEAREASAHGIVGVADSVRWLTEQSVVEFHVTGTAVAVDDVQRPDVMWSTYLAGQRLAKLFEAGFAPVSVAASMSSVQMWPNCQTEYMLSSRAGPGWYGAPVGEIVQVSNAETAVRALARAAVRDQLGGDTLHGARVAISRYPGSMGGHVVECTLRGTRVRRFKDFDPLPAPRPTVRLS